MRQPSSFLLAFIWVNLYFYVAFGGLALTQIWRHPFEVAVSVAILVVGVKIMYTTRAGYYILSQVFPPKAPPTSSVPPP